ncbi:MAG: hypothetical protein ABIH72_04805 [archaeon]
MALTTIVTANIGIVKPYSVENPLKLSAGQTGTVNYELQNLISEDDIKVRITLTDTSEIASVSESEVLVLKGTKDTILPVTVTIPVTATAGQEYMVDLELTEVVEKSAGVVSVVMSNVVSFKVLVVEPEPESTIDMSTLITWIIAIIIIIIIIVIIVKALKSKGKVQVKPEKKSAKKK